ncbi:MAG: methyltransferase domain-containing protein [Desulforhopalus sp.]
MSFLFKKLTRKITNYKNDKSLGSQLRSRRITPLLEKIQQIYNEKGHVSIADIGGTKEYWNIIPDSFLKENVVNITIINLPDFIVSEEDNFFRYVAADACDLSIYENNYFDIAHSNSFIEHVGDWNRMLKYANEIMRIAPYFFVQTPNYWFPIEPHCMTPIFHWLPRPIRVWLVMNFQLGHWNKATSVDQAVRLTESAKLLNKKMVTELFKGSKVTTEKFLLLPESFIVSSKSF